LSGGIDVVFKIYSRYKKAAYADLLLFQMIEGLRYAFPKTMADSNRNTQEW